MTVLSDRLKELRQERDEGQKEVAGKLRINPAALSNYENGTREPNIELLKSLANYYNVSVDYLIGNTNIKDPRIISWDVTLEKINQRIQEYITFKDTYDDTHPHPYKAFGEMIIELLSNITELINRHVGDPEIDEPLILEPYRDLIKLINEYDKETNELYNAFKLDPKGLILYPDDPNKPNDRVLLNFLYRHQFDKRNDVLNRDQNTLSKIFMIFRDVHDVYKESVIYGFFTRKKGE